VVLLESQLWLATYLAKGKRHLLAQASRFDPQPRAASLFCLGDVRPILVVLVDKGR
jgi:hypothetical protein